MTDFMLFLPRRDAAAKPRRAVALVLRDGVGLALAAMRARLDRRRARQAMRLPLQHLSDAQLRDIGLRRCGESVRELP